MTDISTIVANIKAKLNKYNSILESWNRLKDNTFNTYQGCILLCSGEEAKIRAEIEYMRSAYVCARSAVLIANNGITERNTEMTTLKTQCASYRAACESAYESYEAATGASEKLQYYKSYANYHTLFEQSKNDYDKYADEVSILKEYYSESLSLTSNVFDMYVSAENKLTDFQKDKLIGQS